MSVSSLRAQSDGTRDPPAAWMRAPAGDEEAPRLRGIVRDSWWFVVLAVVLSLAGAAVYLTRAEKLYEARAELLVAPVPSSADLPLSLGLLRESVDPTRNLETVARLVTSTPVAKRARSALGLRDSVPSLLEHVDAQPVAQSDLVAVIASAHQPARAKLLADGFARALVDDRTHRLRTALEAILPQLRDALARIPPPEQAASPIAASIGQLEGLRDDPTIRLETPADVPAAPVSPRPALTMGAALVGGLILGLGAVFVLALVDPRVRREEQLRRRYDLPVLARIPRQSTLRLRGRRRPLQSDDLSPAGINGFRGLHVSLDGHRRADATSRSVLVTGPSRGDGKTTTALNLAASLTAAGESVVLIDADLRRPALHRALGVDATLGLFDVAGGAVAFDDALQPAGPGHGGLRLLAAGMRARLLAPTVLTPAAARDIVRCAQHADRSVVIDAPPLNHVPDVLAFIGAVDDVVIAVRLGRTNLRELQDLAELLAHQGVRPAGFVIAGVAGRDYYDYDFT
jgi:succinoglycan biosynthesis transport protein ExoP